MVLETGRLILSPWTAAEWTEFRPIARDPDVMRYITGGSPWSDEQVRDFVDRQVGLYAARGFCRWKLTERASSATIGFCGVGIWRDYLDPEIGWWLARSHWGRGLASEAAAAALRDAFERVGLERIVSVAMIGNAASIRIMRKLGLAPDGEFDSEGVRLVRYIISREGYLRAARAGGQV